MHEIPDHIFQDKAARITNALDPATRTLMTEIDLLNPRRRAEPRNLLHGRARDPAPDPRH